jgi:hypothetical protein
LKTNFKLVTILLLILSSLSFTQTITERYNHLGETFIPEFSSAPFPHSERIDGHTYKDETFSFEEHYNDSSVAIFIPKGFKHSEQTNIVLYFHGWNNNIDKACSKFELIEQFSESNKNAIFVFPEGPKNSKDSHGGKLEEKDGLKNLIDDVLNYLVEKRKLTSTHIDNIILAGHSGAYRVISFCLMRGGLTQNISDVILFDALYWNTDKYINWIENYDGRFINIYTDNGGTKSETENMMKYFDDKEFSYFNDDEINVKTENLLNNRLIFIHSDLTHSEVISKRRQFQIFLITSKLPTIN